jgi:hypothetical protein
MQGLSGQCYLEGRGSSMQGLSGQCYLEDRESLMQGLSGQCYLEDRGRRCRACRASATLRTGSR